jgi:hypothetical protein
MVSEDDMTDRPPPCWPDRKDQQARAIDLWLRRGLADRFGAPLQPAPEDLLRLVSTLFP